MSFTGFWTIKTVTAVLPVSGKWGEEEIPLWEVQQMMHGGSN